METPPRARTRDRPQTDPTWKAVELVQRGRMIVDVATVDLQVAEARLGPFHPTALYFRQALAEAKDAWDRLRAVYGGAAMAAALEEPPATTLELGGSRPMTLVPIRGRTYAIEQLPGTPDAPRLWRLTRLGEDDDDGPYYASRLADGTTRCDCAEWIYQFEGTPELCKHLAALVALDRL